MIMTRVTQLLVVMVSRIRARLSPKQAANIAERSLRGRGLCFHEMRHTGNDGLATPRGNTARIDTNAPANRGRDVATTLCLRLLILFVLGNHVISAWSYMAPYGRTSSSAN